MQRILKSVWIVVLFAFACIAAMNMRGNAQGTSASLTGYISDPSGAAIPEAVVTITNINTNLTQAVQTNAVGTYLIRPLPPGTYSPAGASCLSPALFRGRSSTRKSERMAQKAPIPVTMNM